MTDKPDHLALWLSVSKTDPKYTKPFDRGGFKGTATNATWLAMKATERFGPIGIGWGMEIEDEAYVAGQDYYADNGVKIGTASIHKLRVRLWYMWGGVRGEVVQFGQTQFVGKNKNGLFTDEEAPKKSLTDAMSKCLSLVGFASDIHMGLFDDNKYVSDRNREEEQKRQQTRAQAPKPQPAKADQQDVPAEFGFKNRDGGRTSFGNVTSLLNAIEEIIDDPDNHIDDKRGFAGANYDELRALAGTYLALKKANPNDAKIKDEFARLTAVGKKVGQYVPTQSA